jgi:hypothetical protein
MYTIPLADLNGSLILPTDILKYQFCENPSYGSRIVPSGQTGAQMKVRTERYDEADSQLSQVSESACPGIPY